MKKVAYFDIPFLYAPPLAFRVRYNNSEINSNTCTQLINYIRGNNPHKIDLRHIWINKKDAILIFKTAAKCGVKELYVLNINYNDEPFPDMILNTDLEVLLLIMKCGYNNCINYRSGVVEKFNYADYFTLLRAVCKYKFRGSINTNLIPRVKILNLIGEYNNAVFILTYVLMCMRRKKIICDKFIIIKIFKHICSAPITYVNGNIKYKCFKYKFFKYDLTDNELLICGKYFATL